MCTAWAAPAASTGWRVIDACVRAQLIYWPSEGVGISSHGRAAACHGHTWCRAGQVERMHGAAQAMHGPPGIPSRKHGPHTCSAKLRAVGSARSTASAPSVSSLSAAASSLSAAAASSSTSLSAAAAASSYTGGGGGVRHWSCGAKHATRQVFGRGCRGLPFERGALSYARGMPSVRGACM